MLDLASLVGQSLGQYQLRELLGKGGMGAVFRAYQPALKREVAIKVMLSNLSENSTLVARFIQEAQTAASLVHPHIIAIHDYGNQGGMNYLVMPLLTGGSLSERLKQAQADQRPPLSLGEVVKIINQLASALDYAHNQGVVHRDIKPANVMFDKHGSAYIVDFGIAKLLDATNVLTAAGTAVGTASYMPPEQWRDETLTGAADQYALAVMTYQLITGRAPFEAASRDAMMYKHFNERPQPLQILRADVPEAVSLVLERALAKTPPERFKTVTAFAQALESACAGNEGENSQFFVFPLRRERIATPAPSKASTPSPSAAITGTLNQSVTLSLRSLLMAGAVLAVLILAVLVGGQLLNTVPSASPTPSPSPLPEVVLVPSNTPEASEALATQGASETFTDSPSHTPTDSPSTTPSHTPTDSPSATPDLASIARATSQAITTGTALQQTIEAEITRIFIEDASATASLWTLTPSPTERPVIISIPPDLARMLEEPTQGLRLSNCPSTSICITDISNGRTERYDVGLVDSPYDNLIPAWSVDGRRLSFSGYDSQTNRSEDWYIIQRDTGERQDFRLTGANVLYPVLSPDGRWMAAHVNGALGIVNLQTGAYQTLHQEPPGIYGPPQWSPDSQHIVVSWTSRNFTDLPLDQEFRLFTLGQTDYRTVFSLRRTTMPCGDYDTLVAFSPDGEWVALPDETCAALLMRADGTSETPYQSATFPYWWMAIFYPQWNGMATISLPAASPTASPSPTATHTATANPAGTPSARINALGIWLYDAPAGNRLGTAISKTFPILGISADGEWFAVQTDEGIAWFKLTGQVKLEGDLNNLPTLTGNLDGTSTPIPAPTRTPLPTRTPVHYGARLFEANFEDESLQGWISNLPDAVSIVQIEGTRALRHAGEDWVSTELIAGRYWTDYQLSVRVYIERSTSITGAEQPADAHINVRYALPQYFVGHISALWDYANLDYNSSRAYGNLGGAPVNLVPKRWYTLRIKVIGNELEFYVDNQRILKVSEGLGIERGTIALVSSPGSIIYYDDVQVTNLLEE